MRSTLDEYNSDSLLVGVHCYFVGDPLNVYFDHVLKNPAGIFPPLHQ